MSKLFRIGGICGALRKDSFNRKLLMEAQRLAPKGSVVEILDWSSIPIYNGDLELQPPESVLKFKSQVASCDAILFVTPEYNFSIPGPLKNAIDWASRPLSTVNSWSGKAVATMSAGPGAYPGSSGGHRAQLHLHQTLSCLNTHMVYSPMVCVTGAGDAFDQTSGHLVNDFTRNSVAELLKNLMEYSKKIQ